MQNIREVTETARRVTNQISEDIRSANVGGSVNSVGYKNGLALFSCNLVSCSPADNKASGDVNANTNTNTLVIFNKDSSGNIKSKIYYSNHVQGYLYYFEAGSSVDNLFSTISLPTNIIAGNSTVADIYAVNMSANVSFCGFAPDDSVEIKQQPYISFTTDVKTRNNSPQQIAGTTLQTTVTSRSYK